MHLEAQPPYRLGAKKSLLKECMKYTTHTGATRWMDIDQLLSKTHRAIEVYSASDGISNDRSRKGIFLGNAIRTRVCPPRITGKLRVNRHLATSCIQAWLQRQKSKRRSPLIQIGSIQKAGFETVESASELIVKSPIYIIPAVPCTTSISSRAGGAETETSCGTGPTNVILVPSSILRADGSDVFSARRQEYLSERTQAMYQMY